MSVFVCTPKRRASPSKGFPSPDLRNVVIAMNSTNNVHWHCMAVDVPIDLNAFYGGSRSLAKYRYDENCNRIDNVTDWAMAQFRKHYQAFVVPVKAGIHPRVKKLNSGARQNDNPIAITKALVKPSPPLDMEKFNRLASEIRELNQTLEYRYPGESNAQ